MNRICLVALVGLPALGKTTLCQYLLNYEALQFNILHLCYDNFIQFNSGKPTEYRQQRDFLVKCLKDIVKSIKNGRNLQTAQPIPYQYQYKNQNSKDFVVLCDDNHFYRSMRFKLFQIAREYNTSFCQIYFEDVLQLSLDRNNLRTGSANIPHEVILKMSELLEPPNAIEHKWEENTLVLKSFDSISHLSLEVVPFLTHMLNTHVQPLMLVKTKNLTPQSLVHKLDLLIRKRISTIMTSTAETNNKNLIAKQLNKKRKEILKQFQLKLYDKLDDNINLYEYVDMLS